MARVTHVKRAQQRFHTKPVIDPETGEQKKTPVMKKRWNELKEEYELVQKTTKRGKPVFMLVTEADKSRPKGNLHCDFPGCQVGPKPGEIVPGQAYKHITPKSGPYGGTQKNRHAEHPTWMVWEYSSSLSARLAEISHNFWSGQDSWETEDDVQSALDDAASEIESLAEEKRESASNIEEGFGHPTFASEELESLADELDNWASDVQGASIPDPADYPCELCDGQGEKECDECGGEGEIDNPEEVTGEGDSEENTLDARIKCEECDGAGTVDCDNCDESHTDLDAWREALTDELSIIDEAPV